MQRTRTCMKDVADEEYASASAVAAWGMVSTCSVFSSRGRLNCNRRCQAQDDLQFSATQRSGVAFLAAYTLENDPRKQQHHISMSLDLRSGPDYNTIILGRRSHLAARHEEYSITIRAAP